MLTHNLLHQGSAACWLFLIGTGVGVIYGLDFSHFDSYPIASSAFY